MDSLARKKWQQRLALVIPLVGLAALLAFHVSRPSEEERRERDFAAVLLEDDSKAMGREMREQLREQWKSFPPETRRRLFNTIAQAKLDEAREGMAGMTPEQRRDRLAKVLIGMGKAHIDAEAKTDGGILAGLQSPEGMEMIGYMMEFYQQKLTQEERAELDPLLREWLLKARMPTVK